MSDLDKVNQNDIAWIKETLKRIEAQTTKTNGRVTSLEKFKVKIVTYATIGAAGASLLINKYLGL